jgi:DNA-binding PadR family transcriptional regulator
MARRFFRYGELHLVMLCLLARHPMHGYELMGELARLFGPAYRPSPGSVYPAAEALLLEGLVVGTTDGDRTVYALTDSGRQALVARADMVAALEVRTGVSLSHADELDAAFARFESRLRTAAASLDVAAVETLLNTTACEAERLAADKSSDLEER